MSEIAQEKKLMGTCTDCANWELPESHPMNATHLGIIFGFCRRDPPNPTQPLTKGTDRCVTGYVFRQSDNVPTSGPHFKERPPCKDCFCLGTHLGNPTCDAGEQKKDFSCMKYKELK